MTLERAVPSGALVISAFVTDGTGEWLETQRYFGYSEREARALYAAELERRGLVAT